MPRAPWTRVLGSAALLLALVIGGLELRLAVRGYAPTMLDSPARWAQQRERATRLGERALILVGASRMQTNVDLEVLRRETGLEPVQLAVDGSSFVPVLEGLARDPAVRGTVIVDYADEALAAPAPRDRAQQWQAAFERGRVLSPFDIAERRLGDAWRQRLRSYADGARPLDSVRRRVIPRAPAPQYVVTTLDRSRFIDFAKLDARALYYARAARQVGASALMVEGKAWAPLDAELRERIAALTPRHDLLDAHAAGTQAVASYVAALAARGSRVRFVALPTSGLVRAIDERRYPRTLFWDRFAAGVGAPALHFTDVPAWRDLECPDGSHLDVRQRADFSRSLVEALDLQRR